MDFVIGAIILWVIPIFVAGSIGRAKNRYGIAYGLFLGWIGVVILAVLPHRFAEWAEKQCPDCAEIVHIDARVCKHCGYRFDEAAVELHR